MQKQIKALDALDMTPDNIYYANYIRKMEKSKKKFCDEGNEYSKQYYFLCYMTRKYFKDNILCSFAKLFIGIFVIVLLIGFNKLFRKGNVLKTIIMTGMLGYGIVMIPLSIMYIIANFYCWCKYKDFVTTRNSILSHKIIHFYAEGTDKLSAINWKSVFIRDAINYNEEKRMRGW